jgi:glycosyltransferase involved in cell wall biosynthesis
MLLANSANPLLKHWTPLVEKDIEIIIISIRDRSLFVPDKIITQKIASKLGTIFSYLKLLFKIRKVIREYKPDILVSHYITTYGIIGLLSGFQPHISVPYGSDIYQSPFYMNFLIRRVLGNAKNLVVSTEITKDFLHTKFNIDEEKFCVRSWGIDNNIFNLDVRKTNKKRTEICKEFNILDSGKYIFSPRCLKDVYNQDILLEAFSLIKKEFPDYKLIMLYCTTFKEEYMQKLQMIAKENGLINDIIWIKRVITEEEMADLMSSSEAIINVPKTDQLSSSLLEGIACGCFPIISKLEPYEEVLENNLNGLFVDSEPNSIFDAFKEYKKNQNRFEKNIELNAKKIIDEYNLSGFVDSLEELFLKIMENNQIR